MNRCAIFTICRQFVLISLPCTNNNFLNMTIEHRVQTGSLHLKNGRSADGSSKECVLTMQKAVILEAPSTKQCVERMKRLFPWYRFRHRPVDVRGTLWWESIRVHSLCQLDVPRKKNTIYFHKTSDKLLHLPFS